jgi:DNA invertase Pin-like site-specific DNA recombinase
MGKTKRVGIYLRVSTTGQTEEYVDHGISGSKGREDRPAFKQLGKDAAGGKIDMVAAWSIDRIGRSLQHLVEFMEELKQQGVGLYLHQQNVDSSTAAGKAMLSMCGVFAEFERSIIIERVKAGLARARAQGKTLGRPKVDAATEARVRTFRAAFVTASKLRRATRQISPRASLHPGMSLERYLSVCVQPHRACLAPIAP